MSYSMSRPYTTKLLDMISDGLIIPEQVAQMCLSYMSEDDVKDMMLSNDILTENDEDFNDSMDGDHDSAMASAGFGTDEDYGYYGDEQ